MPNRINSSDPVFLEFNRAQWREFRNSIPMPLTEHEIKNLHGTLEAVSATEVEEIYLPLSRLLNLYIAAQQQLHQISYQFLGQKTQRVPYIIGVAGSVAVGKSTTSRVLNALLSRWPEHRNVVTVTTDNFLYPNKILEQKQLMQRKGFPESFDTKALMQMLSDLKSGKEKISIPLYSHYHYDILPDNILTLEKPDIVIVEGLNVLQAGLIKEQAPKRYVSDYFDFSIYVDAETQLIEEWFLERFRLLREKAKDDKQAFFYQFVKMPDEAAFQYAREVWKTINEKNLLKNILPFKNRARLILKKAKNHSVEKVWLRKI